MVVFNKTFTDYNNELALDRIKVNIYKKYLI